MNTSSRRIVLGAALTVVAIVSHIAPASAMGRSTPPTVQQPPAAAISDRLARTEFAGKQMETALQSQVEDLRQELADLKTRIGNLQDVASAD